MNVQPQAMPRPLTEGSRLQLALKRAFDIVVSYVALTLLSPLIGLIALTIGLTKHPTSGTPIRVRRKKRKERDL